MFARKRGEKERCERGCVFGSARHVTSSWARLLDMPKNASVNMPPPAQTLLTYDHTCPACGAADLALRGREERRHAGHQHAMALAAHLGGGGAKNNRSECCKSRQAAESPREGGKIVWGAN